MKIALVENYGADFVGARLRLALFLQKRGVAVTAIVPKDGCKEEIERSGIRVIEVGSNIRAKGVYVKINYAKSLKKILKEEQFDIVHFFRLQPNIIGTLVAGLNTKSKIVNHVTGLGVVFSTKTLKSYVQQRVIKTVYRLNNFFFKPFTIFQNQQDMEELRLYKRSICIKGSAVNEEKFKIENIKSQLDELDELKTEIGEQEKIRFIFVSRLLKEKGILELIEGFTLASKQTNKNIELIIAGWCDTENPSNVLPADLEEIIKNKSNIQYLGMRSDVNRLLYLCDVGILPTYYREGTPRFLLESMRMKKAIITTDTPGCDHLIDNNGILIEAKSVDAIQAAIIQILEKDIVKLGDNGYAKYMNEFSEEIVYSSILELYKKISD